jgi:hypothetical protein
LSYDAVVSSDSSHASEAAGGVSPFAVVAFTWAMAGLVHNGSAGDFVRVSVDIGFTLAAFAVVLKPNSVRRFAIMLVALVPSMWAHAPYITNHWIIYAFGSAWFALAGIILALRERSLPNGAAWLEMCAPALRIATLIVYFWVVFHKLNVSFFDPELSCAVEMFGWLAGKFGIPVSPWMSPFAIWGTLLAEAAIPVLLAFRRTRLLGIAGGIVFHAMLGINGFFNFTAVVTSLYALFLDGEFGRQLVALRSIPQVARASALLLAFARHRATLWGGCAFFIGLMFLPGVMGWDPSRAAVVCRFTSEVLWLAYTGIALGLLGLAWWNGQRSMGDAVSFRVRGLGWAVVVLFIVNGTSPYLGFKTENSFSMFANLRTEGPYWNHYFVPASVRVLDYQDELVQIVRSSDPALAHSASNEGEWIYYQFHRHVAARPDISVVYRRGGETFDVARIGDDPVLSVPPSAWKQRWLWFRPVRSLERNRCSH